MKKKQLDIEFVKFDNKYQDYFSIINYDSTELPSYKRKSNNQKAYIINGKDFIALISFNQPIMYVIKSNKLILGENTYDISATTHRHELDFIRYALKHDYLDNTLTYKDVIKQINQAKKDISIDYLIKKNINI